VKNSDNHIPYPRRITRPFRDVSAKVKGQLKASSTAAEKKMIGDLLQSLLNDNETRYRRFFRQALIEKTTEPLPQHTANRGHGNYQNQSNRQDEGGSPAAFSIPRAAGPPKHPTASHH